MSPLAHRSLCFLLLTSALFGQWTKQSFPSTEFLWKVRFADAQHGWVAGHKHIFRTTDGGQSWSAQDTSIGSVDALAAVNAQTAVFANWTSAGEKSRGIRRTTDGGTTWVTVDSQKNYYSDIEFPSATVGFASSGGTAGNARLVKKTTDAGASWITISSTFPKGKYELTGIAFPNELTGWSVTYDGFVYKTTNGGSDWILQDSLGAYSFRDIGFTNTSYGWAIGGIAGTMELFRTIDGGAHWTRISFGGSSTREVECTDTANIWIAGSNNSPPYVAKYNSAAGSWTTQSGIDQFVGVESIDMVDASTGYAVGGQGSVYKTTNGGALGVRPDQIDAVPGTFTLSQNFPNPFNPATTIRFSLPERSAVTLKIYAVTGALLDVAVNTMMEAGTYSMPFDASRYASGVYLYTLTAGARTETKRMVLMK